ncbi:MAG: DUF3298 domain-containing protein [Haliscomenobacter sp.]|nr:DUF3298 domain-containing protein [Haliscomenobacter sp.]
MNKTSGFLLLFFGALSWNACQQKAGPEEAPVVEIESFRKSKGTDCDQPDTARVNCATIDFQYPVLTSGADALKDSVGKWTFDYLREMLSTGEVGDNTPSAKTLEESAAVFFDNHESFKGSVMYGAFVAECGSDVVLNDGKHLTLAINGYTFQGGAHGNPYAAVATFDAATGKILTWDDVVTDKAAMKQLLEAKFREARAEAFQEGFEFDDFFVFALPQNFGLTPTGIYCYYNAYEVGPYALGSTEIDVTMEELGALLLDVRR